MADQRVVIVGAGFGGLNAARSLARDKVQITIVDRKNHHTFQPLLYQVAIPATSPIPCARSSAGRATSAFDRRRSTASTWAAEWFV